MLEQVRIRDLLSEYAGADMARLYKVTFQLPFDCRSGTCTTCIQKCLEGEIDQDMAFAIGDEELEQGLRLICIGSPLSDVVLDA
jgi:ferredoxin